MRLFYFLKFITCIHFIFYSFPCIICMFMLIYLKSRTLHVHVWTYCHFTSFTLNLRLSGDHVYYSEWVTRFYGMEMLTQKTQFQPHCDWDQGLPVVLINVHWFVSLSNKLMLQFWFNSKFLSSIYKNGDIDINIILKH